MVLLVYNFNLGLFCYLYSGHKSAVTCLVFDHAAVRLVSGAKASNNDVTVCNDVT